MTSETIGIHGVNSSRPREDRRAARRQTATVGLGWREGREFLVKTAFVLDISMGGCLIAARAEPPMHRTVLIRLDGPLLPI